MGRVRVETRDGWIEGAREGGLCVFRGVPYARPPVGARRFRPPEPPEPWPGRRPATGFGDAAPQLAGPFAHLLGVEGQRTSEDCLSLNVWTPGLDAARRPVLVWIHGGGFTSGSAAWPVFDGARLALRGDAVVITLNYRLGALGFLCLTERAGADAGSAANFGLLDQIAALEWVREHAAALGGDPGRVTVFGQSAGAMSVGTLLGTPRADGLFQRAILQSGAAANANDREEGERVARIFAEELGLGAVDAKRLREIPVQTLLQAQSRCIDRLAGTLRQLAFQPVIDGALLPRAPLEGAAAGPARPLLVGTNRDEWNYFGLADPKSRNLDEAGLLRRCERVLAERGRDAVETYRRARRGRASTEPRDLWFAIQSDRWFRHPAMRLAELQAGRAPAYAYLFTWASPAFGGALGACHALDVPFVFGGIERGATRPLVGDGPAALALSDRMQEAWLAFARGGDPSRAGDAEWPGYDAGRRATMILGEACGVEDAPLEAERAFWDGLDALR